MESNARGSRRVGRLNIVLLVDRGPRGSKVGGLSGARFGSRCRRQPPDQSAPCIYWGPYCGWFIGMCMVCVLEFISRILDAVGDLVVAHFGFG